MNNRILEATEIAKRFDGKEKDIKKLKSDRGIIERTESSRVVLTEDNRQVLID